MNALAVICAFVLIELHASRTGDDYRSDWRARWFDVFRTGLLYSLAVVAGSVATVFVAVLLYSWAGWHNPLPYWVQLVFGFLLADYAWYWWHRWSHGPGWSLHVWHHVPTRLNIWMTHIGHPVFNGLAVAVRLCPLLLFGIDPAVIGTVGVIQVVWTMAAHLNLPIATPSLNRYLVTPQVHRWHHAPGARVNFGLCLTLWDRLHGTYACPATGPSAVGVKDPASYPSENAILAHLAYPLRRGGKGRVKRSACLPPPRLP